jgi:hypothetical protein
MEEAAAEFRRERYSDLVDAERKANGLSEGLVRAQHRSVAGTRFAGQWHWAATRRA